MRDSIKQFERSASPHMKILLHACCGPCSLEPARLLRAAGHRITLAYCNANIQPRNEYDRRLATLRSWAKSQHIEVVEGVYDVATWIDRVGSIEAQGGHPRSDRCRQCYRMRLEEAATYAAEHHFDGLATTLAVSPYQFSDIIHEELDAAAKRHSLISVFEDYRPYYPQATQLSRELGMYRQNYCGCLYSKKEADQERQVRAQEKVERAQKRKREEALQAQKRAEKHAARAAYDQARANQHAVRRALKLAQRAQEQINTDVPLTAEQMRHIADEALNEHHNHTDTMKGPHENK